MHPVLASRTNFLVYLAVWIPLGSMLGFVLNMSAPLGWAEAASITAPLVLVLAFACLTPWYSCRFLPLRSTPVWKLFSNHLLAAVVLSGAVLLMARMAARSLSSATFPGLERRFAPALPVLGGMVVLVYLLAIALHYALFAVQSSREAEVLAREAELKALKAQINPHFLFNSLHSISALTTVDAARAREMCIKLSDFLRHSLRLGDRKTIPFSEELALAQTYLDVEQVRFGQRLRVEQDVDAACADCDVPPMLVQPLVENAIKHGIATLVEGGDISIRARCSADQLRFVIENPFDPEAPSSRKNGIGLANVRNRLAARYGSAARLEIEVDQNRYRVVIVLPRGGTEG
ncbi:MAG TPA: histidine kinase [Bryobacteraceae bacterium]|nr:histidine kinase [Bryobacteraceae bacterium]